MQSNAQQMKAFAEEHALARAQPQAQVTDPIDTLRSEVAATTAERGREKAAKSSDGNKLHKSCKMSKMLV
jgi:hypothetical protein